MPKFKIAREPHVMFWKKLAKTLGESQKTLGVKANAGILTEFLVSGVNNSKAEALNKEIEKYSSFEKGDDFMSASISTFVGIILFISETGNAPENAKPVMKEWYYHWKTSYEKNQNYSEFTLDDLERLSSEQSDILGGDTITWKCTPFFWMMYDSIVRNRPVEYFVRVVELLEFASHINDDKMKNHYDSSLAISKKLNDTMISSFLMDTLYPVVDSHYLGEARKLFGVEKFEDIEIDDNIVRFLEAKRVGDELLVSENTARHFLATATYNYVLLNRITIIEEEIKEMRESDKSGEAVFRRFLEQYKDDKICMEERLAVMARKLASKSRELRIKQSETMPVVNNSDQKDLYREMDELYNENQRLSEDVSSLEEEKKALIDTISSLQEKIKRNDYLPFESPKVVNYFGLDAYIVGEMKKYNVIINIYSPVRPPDTIIKAHVNVLNVSFASHKVWDKLKSFGVKPVVVTETNTELLKHIIMDSLIEADRTVLS